MSSPQDNASRDSPYDQANELDDEVAESSVQELLSTIFSTEAARSNSGNNTTSNDGSAGIRLTGITRQDLYRLLSLGTRSGARVTIQPDYEEDDDDDDDGDYMDEDDEPPMRVNQWYPPHTEPQKAGLELLASGEFGRVDVKSQARRDTPRRNIARTVLNQFSSPVPVHNREALRSNLVPNSNGVTVATYDAANMYTAQFSDDASFFYTCAQDFKLHVFDMRAPPAEDIIPTRPQRRRQASMSSLVTRMPLRKVIQGQPGRWTITDANLSPDNERLIYSSIAPTVYMTSIANDGNTAQIPIHFSDPVSRASPFYGFGDSFGIWSCRFSADGNEVIAGGSKHIFVYDLLANRRTVKITAHADDVNSCCWADTASGNVLVSASDDATLKVWDRRSLGASRKPSGVLMGHTEGLTYVSAKGDGRYIISNGKDQACRLWDLRKMRTNAEYEESVRERRYYGIRNFDYRYPHYPRPQYQAHPKDCSVMTYRGHSVLRTLIRCHFSPAETTGAQYIYSGSADGRIHVWSLDGTVVQVLDRSKTLPASFAADGPEPEPTGGVASGICVRDVSWSSKEPVIMSAAWDAGHGGTAIARHEFKGLSKLPGALEDWAEKKRLEDAEAEILPPQRRSYHMPGRYYGSDDVDEN